MSDDAAPAVSTETPETVQRTLENKFRKRRSRAIAEKDAQKKWESDFDLECIQKDGGLIAVFEKRPFVDCETADELLRTCRMFAHAFRENETECPDIQPEETIDQFCRRVASLWFSKALNRIAFFVSLKTLRFDLDLGIRRDEPYEFEDWPTWPDLQKTVDVVALPTIGKPKPEWKRLGFSSYREWWDHQRTEEEKRKLREQLNRQLEIQHSEKEQAEANANGTPQLFYRAELNE